MITRYMYPQLLGISAYYHDSAACIVKDGVVDPYWLIRDKKKPRKSLSENQFEKK